MDPALKNARLDEQAATSESMADKLARAPGTTLSGMFSELERGQDASYVPQTAPSRSALRSP